MEKVGPLSYMLPHQSLDGEVMEDCDINFILDPQLEVDSLFVGNLTLCQVRLHKCKDFPWVLLIPRQAGLKEIIDLDEQDQMQLMREINTISKVLKDLYNPDKLNVANLGNIVSQLHIHVIARYESDPFWPGPVWGRNLSLVTEESLQLIETWRNELEKEGCSHDYL